MQPGADISLPAPPATILEAVNASRFKPTGLEYLARFEQLQLENSVLAQKFWQDNQEAIKVGLAARQHQVIVDAVENIPKAFPQGSKSAQMADLPPRDRQRFYLAHKIEIQQEAAQKVDEAIHLAARRPTVQNLTELSTAVQG